MLTDNNTVEGYEVYSENVKVFFVSKQAEVFHLIHYGMQEANLQRVFLPEVKKPSLALDFQCCGKGKGRRQDGNFIY